MSSFAHTNPYFQKTSAPDRGGPMCEPLYLLAHRLRLLENFGIGRTWEFPNIDHVHVWVDPATAHILVVKDGKGVVLEDPADVFPSDELVAKFQLMMKG